MALEAGMMALKAVYKLYKMVKEARDNVIFIRRKLDSTESTASILQSVMDRLDPDNCPDGIVEDIKERLAQHRRTTRRMRLKFEPLMSLLNGLGGSSAAIKAQATMLSKGILGATMTLGTVSVLVRRHVERLEARATQLQDSVGAMVSEASTTAPHTPPPGPLPPPGGGDGVRGLL